MAPAIESEGEGRTLEVELLALEDQAVFEGGMEFEALVGHLVGEALLVEGRLKGDVGRVGEGAGAGGEHAEGFGGLLGPGEDGVVRGPLDDFELEADEGFGAFAVQEGHVDVKETEHAVGEVFDPARLTPGQPAHFRGDAGAGFVDYMLGLDFRGGGYFARQGLFGAELLPFAVEEDDGRGREEFLQRPAAGEPLAVLETFSGRVYVLGVPYDVEKIGVAFACSVVPAVHGVDGLRDLGATLFVNATGVDPYPEEASIVGQGAAFFDFGIALTVGFSALAKVLMC